MKACQLSLTALEWFLKVSVMLFTAAFLTSAQAAAECVQTQVGPATVQLATVNTPVAQNQIFRMSVSYHGNPIPNQSRFLSAPYLAGATPNTVNKICRVLKPGAPLSVQTAAGSLRVDPQGQWQLKNSLHTLVAQGAVVTTQAHLKGDQVQIQTMTSGSFKAYGTGNPSNASGGLTVGQGAATSGNGWTVLPYYWSPEGYAALGVSADDDKPASWRLESAARQLSQDLTARGLTWSFVGPVADLYLMPAQDLRQAARSLADLTGHAPVPPKWSFGYLQSRWGWGCGEKPCPSPLTHAEDLGTADIDSTLQHFRTQHFPVDAFIFDFESFAPIEDFPGADYALSCTGDARYHDFTLSSLLFPEPHKEISAYRAQGIQIIPIRKPRIGNLSDLTFLRGQNPAWVNACTNENKNSVDARLMQFDKTGARDWYAQALQPMLNAGVSGWWNDEGEATFSTYYDWNQAELKAEIENAKLRGQAQNRHWSLNRAFSPGLARLGASVWTGDNHSTWTALRQTSTNLLNLSLGGMPYGATDLGGFMGPQNETPAIQANYAQLLTRWLELGVFLPIMRTHSRDTTLPHFPWLAAPYGGSPDPQAVNAIRKALNLRYRLVPYYYSLAHETSITGIPLMRPLAMEYPSDDIVATMTDQWLMGSHLMAAPIQTPSEKRNIYFPETMLSFDGQSLRTANADASRFAQQMLFNAKSSYQVTATLGEIPVFVKTGTILTLAPAVSDSTGWPAQNTSELTDGPLEVQVYEGANTTFTLFEDDGISYDYQNSQLAGFRKTIFKWDETNKILSWQREGTYGTNVFTKIRVVRFDLNGHKTVDPVRELSASGSTAR